MIGSQLPNRVEALIAMCGIERAHCIVTPLMPMYRTHELEHISRLGGMRVLFVPGVYRRFDYAEQATDLLQRGLLDHAISLDPGTGLPSLDQLEAAGEAEAGDLPADDPELDAALMFTSGTTGSPKGVLHNSNTLLSGNRILSRELGFGEEECIFIPAVVGHGTGYVWGMRLALYLGARCALLDVWDAEQGARFLAEQRCTWTMVAPTFVQDLLDAAARVEEIDITSLRYLSCGGAAPPTFLHTRARAELDCELLRLYGQTEAFLSTHCMPGDPAEKLISTEGRPLPGVELRVLGEDGEPLAAGESGEIGARGPHRCVGLLSADGLRRLEVDEWVPSGDLGSIDDAGFLSIEGRIKEFINRGGFKYSPVEVEDVLGRHPAIGRIAIVPALDQRLGERGCACVIPSAGSEITLEEIVATLKAAGMAPFKWPERLELFDAFPQTASGKVQKHLLAAEVERRR